MEVLTEQIAKVLQVSVDKVVEVYPIIRTQMVWYNTLDNLILTNIIMLTFIFAPLLGFRLYQANEEYPIYSYFEEEDIKEAREGRKYITTKAIVIVTISILIAVLLPILRNLVAPDVTLMMMLGK